MNQDLELKLQAWLDGELTAAEAEAMRRLAESDPQARLLAAQLRGLQETLRRHEPLAAVPEAREFYWRAIERRISQEARPEPRRAIWPAGLRWLAPLAGVCALGLVLFMAARPATQMASLNEVSVTADGYQARTSHNQTSGVNFVFLEELPKPLASEQARPARARDDGMSFAIDFE